MRLSFDTSARCFTWHSNVTETASFLKPHEPTSAGLTFSSEASAPLLEELDEPSKGCTLLLKDFPGDSERAERTENAQKERDSRREVPQDGLQFSRDSRRRAVELGWRRGTLGRNVAEKLLGPGRWSVPNYFWFHFSQLRYSFSQINS